MSNFVGKGINAVGRNAGAGGGPTQGGPGAAGLGEAGANGPGMASGTIPGYGGHCHGEPGHSGPCVTGDHHFPAMKEAHHDLVHKPSHYARWKIEPITFIMTNDMEMWRGTIIKYACRAGYKSYDGMGPIESEITDLEKVRRYAEMRINQLNGKDVL